MMVLLGRDCSIFCLTYSNWLIMIEDAKNDKDSALLPNNFLLHQYLTKPLHLLIKHLSGHDGLVLVRFIIAHDTRLVYLFFDFRYFL